MSTQRPPQDPESHPRVKAVFDDMRVTRQTDFINSFWRTLAFSLLVGLLQKGSSTTEKK